jgi:hypothetical protein
MSHNCGCPQNSPSQLTCPPTFSVPVDQFNCPETNTPPQSANSVTYHQALSAFVVPAVGQQSALLVANGSLFAAGQWLQFVNPSGIFRIISITGNTLQLQNAAADGITAIAGNPVPPYQYAFNSAFVAVGDPRQQSLPEFASYVKDALATLQSVCLDNLDTQSPNEEVYLLGYLKTNLCNNDSSACLRKQELAYIDNNGVLHFDGPISAEQFNVPVPPSGMPNNNTTPVNPTGGAGNGFLLPFYNPATGTVSYIDLFAGKANDNTYSFYLSPTGIISLIPAGGRIIFWPEHVIHNGTGAAYAGFPSTDLVIADWIGSTAFPVWAKYVKIRVQGNLFSPNDDSIRVKLNQQTTLWTSMLDPHRGTYDNNFTIPITGGKFNLEIVTYIGADGIAGAGAAINLGVAAGAGAGFIKVSIVELLA